MISTNAGDAVRRGSTSDARLAPARPASAPFVDLTGREVSDTPTAGRITSGYDNRARRGRYNRLLFVELCRSTDVAVALIVLGAAFILANASKRPRGWHEFLLLRLTFPKLVELTLFALLWQQIFRLFDLYEEKGMPSLREEAPRVVLASTVGTAASAVFSGLSTSGAFSNAVSMLAWFPMIVVTLAARYLVWKVAERGHQRVGPERMLVVGSGPLAHRMFRELSDHTIPGEHELVGFVDSNPDITFPDIRDRLIGTLEQLETILMHTVVDEVLIALPVKSHYTAIQRVVEECERAGVRARYSVDVFQTRIASRRLELSDHLPAVALDVSPDDERLLIKRAIDVVGASFGMLVTAPAWAFIALAIRATSGGPVFFAQERYGFRKRRFRMLKFRTMVEGAEGLQAELEDQNEVDGPVFKIARDPRVTTVGRFLRRTSLDELPQLWNVLRGEMSLVGPRPLPIRDVGRFSEAWLMRRFSIVPGITGLWQISGRSNLDFDDWIALDLEYIDGWSLWSDMSILARTVPAVLRGTGAS